MPSKSSPSGTAPQENWQVWLSSTVFAVELFGRACSLLIPALGAAARLPAESTEGKEPIAGRRTVTMHTIGEQLARDAGWARMLVGRAGPNVCEACMVATRQLLDAFAGQATQLGEATAEPPRLHSGSSRSLLLTHSASARPGTGAQRAVGEEGGQGCGGAMMRAEWTEWAEEAAAAGAAVWGATRSAVLGNLGSNRCAWGTI